ncbi:MAG: serine hydrolase domain-containing protein [Candidatus Hodarchaeales archaeon]|jgi:CubicO group peptidase (beta-lactamase class C family)
MKSKKWGLLFVPILVNLIFINCTFSSAFLNNLDYFPNGKWRTSTPEEQKMNSNLLNAMHTKILNEALGVDSILVIRNGYLVYEDYFDYYNYSNLHNLQSVTKSIIGLLIGIANATGFIPDLDQLVLEIFPNRTFENVDTRKQALTIRHLLKMQMGIDWILESYGFIDPFDYALHMNMTDEKLENWPVDPNNDFIPMINSDDWVQYILNKPLMIDPGTVFKYNDGASHLLSAIIQKKAGINTVAFAKQYLFNPLNITDYHWWNDSQGIAVGSHGLWLHPLDMAKIGYLCLNNGIWNDTQVVPESWIQESINPSPNNGYGYQWVIDTKFNFYKASGLGSQFIVVRPEKSLVVVMTTSNYNTEVPGTLLYSPIFASILSDSTTTAHTTSTTSESVSSDQSSITDVSTTSSTTNATTFSLFGVTALLLLTFTYRKKKK